MLRAFSVLVNDHSRRVACVGRDAVGPGARLHAAVERRRSKFRSRR